MIRGPFMSPSRRSLPALFAFLLAMLLPCGALLGGCLGGATETETGTAQISGRVEWTDGRPAGAARLRMRPADYLALGNPAASWDGRVQDTVSDAAGRFAFDAAPAGDYVMEALYPEGYAVMRDFSLASAGSRVDLDRLILVPTGTVTGKVRFADGGMGPVSVSAYGLEHWTPVDTATGLFTLPDMPAGMVKLRVASPVAFTVSQDVPDVRVESRKTTEVPELLLEKRLKQDFTVADGSLDLPGVTGDNPVVYDNDFASNTPDNEFLWALASQGRIDLRGNLVSAVLRDSLSAVPEGTSEWNKEARICRLSGMRNIPEPILGATRKLAYPASGKWEDIVPEMNDGVRLLVSEARMASVEKPLLVIVGGALTTEADAILADPTIADKMIVFGIYNQGTNGRDTLAAYMVAKKCRFVEFGRTYGWKGASAPGPALPGNWVGTRIKSFRDTTNAFDFFTDLGPVAYLANRLCWKGAKAANAVSAPLNVSFNAGATYDFIDIPADGVDWALMSKEFFASIGNAGSYHPWPVPGAVEGVSFRSASGAGVDSVPVERDVAEGKKAGAWLEYSLEADGEGTYDLILRYRCAAAVPLRILDDAGGLLAEPTLPAAPAWGEAAVKVHLRKGVQAIRMEFSATGWSLGRLSFNLP